MCIPERLNMPTVHNEEDGRVFRKLENGCSKLKNGCLLKRESFLWITTILRTCPLLAFHEFTIDFQTDPN